MRFEVTRHDSSNGPILYVDWADYDAENYATTPGLCITKEGVRVRGEWPALDSAQISKLRWALANADENARALAVNEVPDLGWVTQ